ncbi:MAG: ATP-binding cassette domain-containing protein, partial [bacterium]
MKQIQIENVTVCFRENTALKNINLDIDQGSFTTVIGPNGAGKTTLLTVINGLGKIIQGKVQVFGMPMRAGNFAKIRKQVGYVPQNPNIDPRFPISVQDVVKIGISGRTGLFKNPDKNHGEIVLSAMNMV